ncbi:Serine/threonine-protein kinase PknH [Stieleria neptunia]|uniref:Serine/threonine-protein kinase PknH n=1 Tax=Stieleria neptunia TaxID=2527979 RepID=A0A518HM62_9BACT|nr:SUMF1/EgtB/PvdO family nonheme iron enzyme [Stieleria neptunia]QDV41867.1 Serine/threonine-protein kinase PknH [Stieleria neptunia]
MTAPDDSAEAFDRELSLLRELRDWEGDPFELESGCIESVSKVRSLSSKRGDAEHATDIRDAAGDPFPPLKIGPYQLLSNLGQGGMGRVFKARHERLDRIVALKVLTASKRGRSAINRRFRREMKALGKISHPNIVAATDGGMRDGIQFLAMELVDGVTFSQLLRYCRPLAVADACELARQTAIGLAAAHGAGLIHRDIKPSNLMLTLDHQGAPVVKILDLGLASICDPHSDRDELTATGQVIGTLEFMSPEQGLNSRDVDYRADIYSLGATLTKMLCGKTPSHADANTTAVERAVALTTRDAPSISTLRDDLPPQLVALIDQMVRRLPEQRPADLDEIADRLLPFAQDHQLAKLLVACPKLNQRDAELISDAHLIGPASGIHPATVSLHRSQAQLPKSVDRHDRLGLRGRTIVLGLLIVSMLTWYGFVASPFDRAAPSALPIASTESPPQTPSPDASRATLPKDWTAWNLSSNLIAYWPIDTADENRLADRSGNGHAAVDVSEGRLMLRDGAPLPGERASLNVVAIAEPIVVNPQRALFNDEMTVAFWIKRKHFEFDVLPILRHAAPTSGFSINLTGKKSQRSGKIMVDVFSESRQDSNPEALRSDIDAFWHHIAVARTATELRLYVDGRLVDSTGFDNSHRRDDAPLRIGAQVERKGISILMDELVLLDRALDVDEIVYLTQHRLPPKPLLAPVPQPDVRNIRHQWAKDLDVDESTYNSIGMKLCLVPPGEFTMGTSPDELQQLSIQDKRKHMHDRYLTETPAHRVRVSRPMYVAAMEVTQSQYEAVMGENPASFSAGGEKHKRVEGVDTGDFPVDSVSWFDAIEFCNRLSEREGLKPCYDIRGSDIKVLAGDGYRLPTEAEWEYACRAGTETPWSFGENDFQQSSWVVANALEQTHPVAQLRPNALGLYDMHGNVFEWCFDFFDEDTYTDCCADVGIDPTGPTTGTRRVFRGGSWWQRRPNSRSAFRGHHFPHFQSREHGFRIVRPIDRP